MQYQLSTSQTKCVLTGVSNLFAELQPLESFLGNSDTAMHMRVHDILTDKSRMKDRQTGYFLDTLR